MAKIRVAAVRKAEVEPYAKPTAAMSASLGYDVGSDAAGYKRPLSIFDRGIKNNDATPSGRLFRREAQIPRRAVLSAVKLNFTD